MSMSQEEIEALMNGLDVSDSGNTDVVEEVEQEESSYSMSEDDIAKLLEETNESNEFIEETPFIIETEEKNLDVIDVKDNISEVLNEIENMEDDIVVEEELQNIDTPEENDNEYNLESEDFEQKAKTWAEDKIEKAEFPFPAEPSTKVVSQLSEVANDNEEKAGQIFDVLSYILDDNAIVQKNNKKIDDFLDKQSELLNTLTHKFPNIKLFEENLAEINLIKEITKDTKNRLNEEDMKLFEAMELMQFNDINRQKIERVMSVIRKLALYLNNLFEEDEKYEEISVAKHIHGDNTPDLVGADDLDALIAEFNK